MMVAGMIGLMMAGCSTLSPSPSPPSPSPSPPPLLPEEGAPEIPAYILDEDTEDEALPGRPQSKADQSNGDERLSMSSPPSSPPAYPPSSPLASPLPLPPTLGSSGTTTAILLPLSGKHAALGEELWGAAEMALFDAGRDDFILLPLDTKSEEVGARQAAEQAVRSDSEIILGPVYAENVTVAAPVVLGSGRRLWAFSSDRRVAGNGVSIFGHLREEEILRAVAHAVDNGARRFALIASQGEFADRIQMRLSEALQKQGRGATLGERIIYDPSRPLRPWVADFARRTMIDDPSAPMPVAGQAENPPKKIFVYDTVILAVDQLIDVAAMLSYYDIDTSSTHIIIDGRWNSQRLWDEPALEGALFAAARTSGKEDFERRYHDLYGRFPSAIAAIVYDAVRYVVDPSNDKRERLSGLIRLDDAGLPVRDIRLFRVGRSSILPL